MEDIQSVVTIKELYSLDQTMAKPLLEKLTYPWEALPLIKGFVLELGKSLDKDEYKEVVPLEHKVNTINVKTCSF